MRTITTDKIRDTSEDTHAHRIDEKLETTPSLGAVNVHIVLANHATKEDAQSFAHAIKNCDIYIPEQSNWDATRQAVWQNVSDGNMTPVEALNHESDRGNPFRWEEFFTETLNQLYNTQKTIVLVDLPCGSEIRSDLMKLYGENPIDESSINWNLSYEQNKGVIRDYIEKEFGLHAEREKQILEGLQTTIGELNSDGKSLNGSANICMTIGLYHQNLVAELRALAIANVTPELISRKGEDVSHLSEVEDHLSFEQVKDILSYARAFDGKQDLEDLLVPYMAFDLLQSLTPEARQLYQEDLGLQSSSWRETVRGFKAGKFDEETLKSFYSEIRSFLSKS